MPLAPRVCRRGLALAAAAISFIGVAAAEPSPLRVGGNGHTLEPQSGTPFFWLADTGWYFLWRLDEVEAHDYMRIRKDQGFTVIQAMLVPGQALRQPARSGEPAFLKVTPAELAPNPAYFDHVARVLRRAGELGLYVMLLPASKSYLRGRDNASSPALNSENARRYGEFLGRRFAAFPHIVWCLGGDVSPADDAEMRVVRALAEGLKAGGADQLMTYHPRGTESSAAYFHDDDWLDFNLCQSAHRADASIAELVGGTRRRIPAKPVIDGECLYENIPCPLWRSNASTPKSTAYEVRRALYRGVFVGGCGATYGANSVFQFHRAEEPASYHSTIPWREGLFLPAARQVRHLRELMMSRNGGGRVPAPELLASAPGQGIDLTLALIGVDRSFGLIHSGGGQPFTVDLTKLTGTTIRATWFDPRTGETIGAGEYARKGLQTFTPPVEGEPEDWVLILDDAAHAYPAPGRLQEIAGP